ncbi:uncharacterized protein LOC135694804 [Rhopilema esculentum]|uniref:uncharacterized protein LOC135694804 n=1 Tax=Rhopilema esculentum TaxID=499914 RepID=UPI0031D46FA5
MKPFNFKANESGSSNAMELDGAKRCFQYIKNAGLTITTFISDRHKGIAKWIRESQPETSHFNDLWHVCKGLTKKILKGSKEKGFEVLKLWLKGIRKHLYWCALSTKQGFGELIVAKWRSLMRHIANKHDEHPSQLYNKCAHVELEPREWIPIGTPAYDKLLKILCNTTALKDVQSLSCDAQTSCLEGFHSTLNHWHPKMVHFSWLGTYCR